MFSRPVGPVHTSCLPERNIDLSKTHGYSHDHQLRVVCRQLPLQMSTCPSVLQLLISFCCSQSLTVQFGRTGQADKGRVAGVKEQGFQSRATWGPIPALLLAAV